MTLQNMTNNLTYIFDNFVIILTVYIICIIFIYLYYNCLIHFSIFLQNTDEKGQKQM